MLPKQRWQLSSRQQPVVHGVIGANQWPALDKRRDYIESDHKDCTPADGALHLIDDERLVLHTWVGKEQ